MTPKLTSKPFGELAEFRNGVNFAASDRGAGDLAVIGVGDFQTNDRLTDFSHLERIARPKSLDDDALLRDGDLVFVRSNGNKALIGRCMVLEGINGPVSHSGFTIRARLTSSDVTADWVGQYFATGLAKRDIMRRGGGTNISNLSQQILQDLPIPVPESSYGEKVLRIAAAYSKTLKSLDDVLRAKRTFKRGLMQQLLTGRKRFPEFGAPSQGEGPPADWQRVRLVEVVQVRVSNVDKHVHEGEERVPLCNYMDVWRNDHITADLPFMNGAATGAEIRKFGLRVGDVLLTKDSETPEEIAKSAVVESVVPGLTLGYHVALLRPDEDQVRGDFLAAQLAVGRFRKHFVRKAAGATRFGLSIGALESAEVWLPSVAEQHRIATVNRLLHSEIELLAAQREQIELERRALLSRLLSGSLSVP